MGKLWDAIKNTIRGARDEAATSLEDVQRDSKFAIEDSKKAAAKFETDIANLMKSTNILRKQLTEHEEDIKKWKGIAERAAEAGNADDARQALTNKAQATERRNTTKTEIAKNEKLEATLRGRLEKVRAKISQAESDHVRLSAQNTANKVRTSLAKSGSEFGNGDSPLSKLDDLKKAVQEGEAEAEAWEELAEDGDNDLADKYSASSSGVEDELAKLMAKSGAAAK